jgi:hypothetical protein
MNNSTMTRKFERLLFDGVPEQPEAVYERDDNGIITWRMSGRSLDSSDYAGKPGISMGSYQYDLETGKVTYVPNPNGMESLLSEIEAK